jgi:hypothetical protein
VAATAEPTAAAVESATTAAAEAATAVVTAAAYAIGVITTRRAARETPGATCVSAGPGISNAAAIPNPTAIAYSTVSTAAVAVSTAAIAVAAASPIPAVPGAGADKEAAYEPARPVISIRSASIRRIRVVAPRTNRSAVPVTVIAISVAAADSDTDPDLGVRGRSRHQR